MTKPTQPQILTEGRILCITDKELVSNALLLAGCDPNQPVKFTIDRRPGVGVFVHVEPERSFSDEIVRATP